MERECLRAKGASNSAPERAELDAVTWLVMGRTIERYPPVYGKLTTVTGVSGFAMVDDPPVLLITFRIPPNPRC